MSQKVSSAKGKSGQKKQGQKHKNQFAFVPNKFSSVALKIASLPIEGVCKRCTEILQWKQRMGKYKPLTQPKTCLNCNRKKVMHAYHTHCLECATTKNICAKCHESNEEIEIINPFSSPANSNIKEESALEEKIKRLSERRRRTYYRKMENGDEESANLILESINSDSDYESNDEQSAI